MRLNELNPNPIDESTYECCHHAHFVSGIDDLLKQKQIKDKGYVTFQEQNML